MVVVSFSARYRELQDKSKLHTIRPAWRGRRYRVGLCLDMWWLSPRVKPKSNLCYKMGIAEATKVYTIDGRDLTEEIAKLCGFPTLYRLHKFLMDSHSIDMDKMLKNPWWIVKFKWITGPEAKENVVRMMEKKREKTSQRGFCPKTGDMITIPDDCYKCDDYCQHTFECSITGSKMRALK